MGTLVIRFSSVGDIVLAGTVTRALAPVTFLTLDRYAELAALLPGVTEVRTWETWGRSAVNGMTAIIDLHASPRSRWATWTAKASVRRVRRYDLKRRSRVFFKTTPGPPVIHRYQQAAGTPLDNSPWHGPSTGTGLVLIPGAAHPTKQWPLERFIEIAQRWPGPISAVGGPSDARTILAMTKAVPALEGLSESGFSRTYDVIRSRAVALGGDTGLMHLAAAAGLRTLPLFGPTHSQDGFWLNHTTPIEEDLECRPCSRHGGDICPIGDHLCMTGLSTDKVWESLVRDHHA
jgi:heptosyltransferase-2